VAGLVSVGVPLITQELLSESPLGSVGDEVQELRVTPPLLNVVGVTVMTESKTPVVPVAPV
jgi:hypothetical protein